MKINIQTDNGETVTALAPIIVSASRATDIPAFYSDWFFNRLARGYAVWRNPFNGADCYVSFSNTRFIVFWSKNPAPLLPHLQTLRDAGIGCYIQYTLNDYVHDDLEPHVPSLEYRINTFKQLVERLGMGRVVWRFDPLLLTDRITIEDLLGKISHIGDQLAGYSEKLVFSFADISSYRRVPVNLQNSGINYTEWDDASMMEFASRLSEMNARRWGYTLATCAERIGLERFGIAHNRCIDPELISRIMGDDKVLMDYLDTARRDPGQRKLCGCILSKDIGSYNTCVHGCAYCYANTSQLRASINRGRHNPYSETIV